MITNLWNNISIPDQMLIINIIEILIFTYGVYLVIEVCRGNETIFSSLLYSTILVIVGVVIKANCFSTLTVLSETLGIFSVIFLILSFTALMANKAINWQPSQQSTK